MQSQATVAAAAGLTIERDTWHRLDVLVAIANELEPAALDKQLEDRRWLQDCGMRGSEPALLQRCWNRLVRRDHKGPQWAGVIKLKC